MAGYSGRPLALKLSLKPGMRVSFEAMPDSVAAEIAGEMADLVPAGPPGLDAVIHFTRSAEALGPRLRAARDEIAPAGMIWVAWPKRASGVATDITEDVVRALALPLGLVDIKVCAIDATWSGLKLVIRKALR